MTTPKAITSHPDTYRRLYWRAMEPGTPYGNDATQLFGVRADRTETALAIVGPEICRAPDWTPETPRYTALGWIASQAHLVGRVWPTLVAAQAEAEGWQEVQS